MSKEDFKRKIDDRITTSFSVTFIPVKQFRRFKELAKEEFRDNYAMTIKFLMDNWEKHQFVLEQLNQIWKEISQMNMHETELNQKAKPKTFGSEEKQNV